MNDREPLNASVVVAPAGRRFAELLAASAFAVAQPMYVRLNTQSAFLLDTGTTPLRLVTLTVLMYLAVPLLLLGIELLVGRRNPLLQQVVHTCSMAGLVFLFCLLVWRRQAYVEWIFRSGMAAYVTLLAAGIVAVLVARLLRRRWMQQLLLLGACGSLLFPIVFLRSGAAASILTPASPPWQAVARRPAPVVMLIFDEFCGMSLLNEDHEIDAVRYPNFARLAAIGTWYRNASTVHARTNFAVPALLTGQMPLADREMTLAEAPQNLFTLLQSAGYATAAFEPVSRLHPGTSHMLRSSVSLSNWCALMARSLTAVYVQAVMPDQLPLPLPSIPRV